MSEEAYFVDGFESGDLSWSQGGFAWTSSVATDVSTAMTRTGNHSLRFSFEAGGPSEDAFAEQRFAFGSARSEVFARYYLYLPDGTEAGHRRFVVRSPEGPDNNKFFRLWHDDYSGPFKWGASMRSTDDGVASLFGETRVECDWGAGPLPDGDSWTIPDAMLGRWILVEWYVRGDEGTGSGALQVWLDGGLAIDETDVSIGGAPCGPNVFLNGYLLGWANSGFDEETFAYIDDVAFSDAPFESCVD